VPENLYDLLTYESLAHWIMGDGTYNSGIRIQTDCFTIKEVVFIINVIYIKFNIMCFIHYQRGNPILYIPSKYVSKIYPYLKPYIISSMEKKFKRDI
jgi:hypothetical protein